MNGLDISFEPYPWESWLRKKQSGDVISASALLALLEGEEEQSAEDCLQEMEMACMMLDISDLPRFSGSGELARRLVQEEKLAKEGLDPRRLEEGDPLRLYLEEVAGTPAFGEESLLAERCRMGDETAQVPLTNLGLSRVIELAREYAGYGVLLLDLIQEGSLGLWQAIRCYHHGEYGPHRDRWIRFYLAKTVFLQARAGGIGQKMRRCMEDYRAVDARLLADLGRNATLEEIALELHMTVEETERVRQMIDNARMMQTGQEEEEKQDAPDAEQAVENTALFQMRQRISELLSNLEETDAKLLTLRFGLEGGQPLSPEEVGRILGISAEEAVAREGAALAKLRSK